MSENNGEAAFSQDKRAEFLHPTFPTAKELTHTLGGKWANNKGKARCPAHNDDSPSLDIEEKDGRTLYICRAGCHQDDVTAALKKMGLLPEAGHTNGYANGHAKAPPAIVARYPYVDESGTLQFEVVRYAPKDFKQRRPNGRGGWIWNLKGQPPLIYNLTAVREAIAAEQVVFAVEGEKDVENLSKIGITATCNAAGAGKWKPEHAAFLAGARVVIIPDNDEGGRKHADTVARSLAGKATSVRLMELSGLPPKGDTSDWLNAGGTADDLWALVDQVPEWAPAVASPTDLRVTTRQADINDDLPHWIVTPWPEEVDGAALLDDICKVVARHMYLPDHAKEAIAAWVLFVWTVDAFSMSPLLITVSPTKQCGKTTLLVLLYWMTPFSEIMSNVSASSIFRAIEEHRQQGRTPTFLLDEVDSYIHGDEDMRGILNSGQRRIAAWARRTESVGREFKPRRFSTWAPKVLATIRAIADTLMDRGLIISLTRKPKGASILRFKENDTDELQNIRSKCLRWATDHTAALKFADPALPEALDNRPGDNWRPLFAVAAEAGGKWPERIRSAALALTGVSEDEDRGTELLRDVRAIFEDQYPGKQDAYLGAQRLVDLLIAMPETPWAEYRVGDKPITARGVWRLLKPFNIASKRERDGRRYLRQDFEGAWKSYLEEPKRKADGADQSEVEKRMTGGFQ